MTRRTKAKDVRFRDRRRTAAARKGNPEAISHVRPTCPHPLKRAFDTQEQAEAQMPRRNYAYLCKCGCWHTATDRTPNPNQEK